MTSPTTARILTPFEQDAFDRGLARWYRDRLIPIIRGAEETDEEKAAREAREKAEREAADKTFTQAELDRIVQERLARDRRDRPTDAEIADLREKAKKLDDAEAANQTELERERAKREKAEKEAADATERANKTLIQASVLAAGTEHKALKPEHLSKLIDMNGVTVGDDGQVTGASEAVKAFLDANPEYVGSGNGNGGGNGGGGNNGANGGGSNGADQGARTGGKEQLASTDGMSSEEIATAVAEGRLDTYLATTK